MSVLDYRYSPQWSDEDFIPEMKRRAKRAEERDWKKQVEEELEEMGIEDE